MPERIDPELHHKDEPRELAQLKQALDAHAIVAMTDARGRIIFVNDKFCAISKYAREELMGQDHRIINSGRHPKKFFQQLWTTIGHGQIWKGEICNRAKDGSIYWVDTTIVPFLGDDGKPKRYVAIRADVTARKVAEAKILELNRSLEARVEERTRALEVVNRELESFSYSVSHDLRAPLRHIQGFANLLKAREEGKLDEKSAHYLQVITNSTRRLGELVDELLVFSRMGRLELNPVACAMNAIVEETLEVFADEIRLRGAVVEVPPMPTLWVDPVMFRQVWQNLIGNALKYSRDSTPPRIDISYGLDDERGHVFSIRDNGVGFDIQYANKLFGVFQRLHTEEEFEGNGIGLANVRRILTRHGGSVWAEGKVGEGACFSFALPTSASDPA